MSFTCVTIEGGLLAPDFLEVIADAEGQKPADFGLADRRTLVDEVSSVWSDVRSYWDAFGRRLARAGDESRTTITREQWVLPLLETLGYQLAYQQASAEVGGRSYRISHRAGVNGEGPPVQVEPFDQDLGTRPPSGRGTMSPHALIQDYLNRTDHLWAVVTNGSTLRLLRDSSYFTRPSYIEFDLQQMLEGERLDEFFLLYRLCHRTRLPWTADDAAQCLLETYHQQGLEQGGRIRDGLRVAVQQSIELLGNGFLKHGKNEELREAIAGGKVTPQSFYQQLLYLIYRLLFLMVGEERGLLSLPLPPGEGRGEGVRPYFSITRLRQLADEPLSSPERFADLYLNLRALCFALCRENYAAALALPPLNGELFENRCTPQLGVAHLDNGTLLQAIGRLSHFTPQDEKVRRRVNYGALDVEELGSVYESLLDFQPILRTDGPVVFELGTGTERKTTGSYYTRPELVQELIRSALVPVIEDRLASVPPLPPGEGRGEGAVDPREQALLSLKVCDPACGSGHFLLAAARRIGNELAKVRTGEEAPAPDAVRAAVRDVITHCIYGVDKNPLAVDLCKVALWIEGHAGGKPLTFLDHRIRCGDSLVGVFDLSVLEDGIPDKAFDAVSGDDKAVAKAVKRKNKDERKGQPALPFEAAVGRDELLATRHSLLTTSDDTPEDVHRKREAFDQWRQAGADEQMACHFWTAAFFAELTPEAHEAGLIPTTDHLRRFIANPDSVDAQLRGRVLAMAQQNRFFHWPLEFPEVFEQGGFDCVLSNPPWDMMQLDPQEFFSSREPGIAAAKTAAERSRMVDALRVQDPGLHAEFVDAQFHSDKSKGFVHASARFPLTQYGRSNLAPLFAELSCRLVADTGRTAIIVPAGIATDAFTQHFFRHLMENQRLAQLVGFENEAFIFADVHHSFRFCVLTICGTASRVEAADFVFFCRHFGQVADARRHFSLSWHDVQVINPNTRTCSVFRSSTDAELVKSIHRGVPPFLEEDTGHDAWGVRFRFMFVMNTDSHLFRRRSQLVASGHEPVANRLVAGDSLWIPLYEAKMAWQFDHRYGTEEGTNQRKATHIPAVTAEQHADASFVVHPLYWVDARDVAERKDGRWPYDWHVAYRRVTQSTNERTLVCCVIPDSAISYTLTLVEPGRRSVLATALAANLGSLISDYDVRQKTSQPSLPQFCVEQLAVLPPDAYAATDLLSIVPRVVELTYTAWDVKAFADDVWRDGDDALRQALERQWEANRGETGGHSFDPPEWAEIADDGCPLPPFKWSEGRRAVLRAELDAHYARLYGLNRKQLRYILDPHGLSEKELEDILDPWEDPTVSGPHLLPAEPAEDFPGETFRVLKNKEEKQFGEYRTRRLVLEAWERQGRTP